MKLKKTNIKSSAKFPSRNSAKAHGCLLWIWPPPIPPD